MNEVFRVPRNGTTLVGDSWLTDRPVITLLHAGVADRRSWFTLAAMVSDFASVLAYDRRGFGESLPGSEQFTHLEDLLAVLDQLGIGRTWLIGSSAGGKLAIEAALEATDRVEGMILISPAIGGAPPTRDEDVDAQTEEIDGLITLAEERGDLNEMNRLEVHWWLDGPRQVEGRVVGSIRNLVLDMNAIALANFVQENGSPRVCVGDCEHQEKLVVGSSMVSPPQQR
jgi:pimeloyl-ACP methyl ester carboxylesterase